MIEPDQAEPTISWAIKLSHELTAAERHAILFHEPAPHDPLPLGAQPRPVRHAIGGWVIFLIGLAVMAACVLASIHETTERACPTMDAACQVAQESPQ